MQKYIFLLFVLFLVNTNLYAQTDDLVDEGSVYSKFGLGMPVDFGSPSATGMGLWGVSFSEPYMPGVANPAQWGNTVYAVATGGVELTTYYASDQFGSAQHSNLSVNHFQLLLPIYKDKLGLSASFTPYTNTSYQIFDRGTRIISNGISQDTLDFITQNFGDGGVNRLELGLGWNINSTLYVGYAASLVFASIDNSYTTVFDSNEYRPVNFTRQTSGTGFGNRAGVYLTLPSIFKPDDRLSLGASINFPVTIDAERVQQSIVVAQDSDSGPETEDELVNGSIQLPMGILAGVTYQPIPKLSFTAEGQYQEWSDYRNTLKPGDENFLTDRYKIGAGIRYFPFLTGSDKFLSTFKYRFGVFYDTGHLKINDTNIETLLFSVGLGYISPLTNSSIDLSLQYGMRGTKTQNLVKENIWRVKLSLNLAELFFFRPKIQ